MRQRIHVSASTMQIWIAIEDEVAAIAKERNCFLHRALEYWFCDLPSELYPDELRKYAMTLDGADPDAITIVSCE